MKPDSEHAYLSTPPPGAKTKIGAEAPEETRSAMARAAHFSLGKDQDQDHSELQIIHKRDSQHRAKAA
jgi:hypothetical protein